MTEARSFASGWVIDGSDPLASRLRGRRGDRFDAPVQSNSPEQVATPPPLLLVCDDHGGHRHTRCPVPCLHPFCVDAGRHALEAASGA